MVLCGHQRGGDSAGGHGHIDGSFHHHCGALELYRSGSDRGGGGGHSGHAFFRQEA